MYREWLSRDFCQSIYEEWMAEAVAKGRIKAPGFFSDPLRRKAYCKAEWNGPARGKMCIRDRHYDKWVNWDEDTIIKYTVPMESLPNAVLKLSLIHILVQVDAEAAAELRDIADVLSITANTDKNIQICLEAVLRIADRLERRKNSEGLQTESGTGKAKNRRKDG